MLPIASPPSHSPLQDATSGTQWQICHERADQGLLFASQWPQQLAPRAKILLPHTGPQSNYLYKSVSMPRRGESPGTSHCILCFQAEHSLLYNIRLQVPCCSQLPISAVRLVWPEASSKIGHTPASLEHPHCPSIITGAVQVPPQTCTWQTLLRRKSSSSLLTASGWSWCTWCLDSGMANP